jgi:hypothetical protein
MPTASWPASPAATACSSSRVRVVFDAEATLWTTPGATAKADDLDDLDAAVVGAGMRMVLRPSTDDERGRHGRAPKQVAN